MVKQAAGKKKKKNQQRKNTSGRCNFETIDFVISIKKSTNGLHTIDNIHHVCRKIKINDRRLSLIIYNRENFSTVILTENR